jgi:hypothetical protein
MTRAAQQVLKTFELLPEQDRQEVTVEILRRTPLAVHENLDDSDYVFAADQVFLDLDRREESE